MSPSRRSSAAALATPHVNPQRRSQQQQPQAAVEAVGRQPTPAAALAASISSQLGSASPRSMRRRQAMWRAAYGGAVTPPRAGQRQTLPA